MPCAKGMRACKADCLHRAMVRGYQQERERQETEIEQQTEREPDEFDLITFKRWLLGHAGRRAA